MTEYFDLGGFEERQEAIKSLVKDIRIDKGFFKFRPRVKRKDRNGLTWDEQKKMCSKIAKIAEREAYL